MSGGAQAYVEGQLASSGDHLKVSENPDAMKKLENDLRVLFSAQVEKINRKGKVQSRVLLVTQSALYNIKSISSMKILRRIDLSQITGILCNTLLEDDDFVIQVSAEYDYKYRSSRKVEVIQVLVSVCERVTGHAPRVKQMKCVKLEEIMKTKPMWKKGPDED